MANFSGRPVIFGEVLFDRFPDGNAVLGGAPFNVAWHLQGFGCAPLVISRVGEDAPGRLVRQAMQEWGLDSAGLQIDGTYPTGAVEIQMSGTKHSFNILPDQAYDHIDIGQSLEATKHIEASLFYHGSLAMRTARVRHVLEDLLTTMELPIFVDVNLRDPWWREEDLPPVFQRARWVKVNDEELEIVARQLSSSGESLEKKALALKEKYDLGQLIVTLGAQGALAFEDSQDAVKVTPEHKSEIVDTVGAGDAFSSVILLGLIKGWPSQVTMQRAQDFASRICLQRGATSPVPGLYLEMITKWGETL